MSCWPQAHRRCQEGLAGGEDSDSEGVRGVEASAQPRHRPPRRQAGAARVQGLPEDFRFLKAFSKALEPLKLMSRVWLRLLWLDLLKVECNRRSLKQRSTS